ncbi:MAG: type 4a pilus biogenesis protein PilO [Deltaproteobacteria bacterium]|nr:type 4a pilus biogenesis protein PilO [Deltaproteobacteria bacterium]
MALNELGERFSKIPIKQKYFGLVAALVLLSVAFYFMFYADLAERENKLDRVKTQLEVQKASYEEKRQNYMAFRSAVKKLLQNKKELLKELPTSAEIPSFLQSLHAQAELAGLNIKTFKRGKEQRRGFYGEIPVKMVIEGTYHQITKFFYSVGNLKRIVTIKDVLLKEMNQSGAAGNKTGIMLNAKFVASTFRFVESKKKGSGARKRRPGRRG